jgi:hypothetical protein
MITTLDHVQQGTGYTGKHPSLLLVTMSALGSGFDSALEQQQPGERGPDPTISRRVDWRMKRDRPRQSARGGERSAS